MKCQFDQIIVSAPNEAIASSYGYQLQRIKSTLSNFFETSIFFCCADPKGKRIGSGGGTLHAIKEFQRSFPDHSLSSTRTLLIHSGGDSRRAPFYSVLGKAFVSLNSLVADSNSEGEREASNDEELIATPLLLLIRELSEFFQDLPPNSLVITCSDVLLKLHSNTSRSFPTNDLTIVTLPAVVTTAVNHGVLYNQKLIEHLNSSSSSSSSITLDEVDEYLQKPSLTFLSDHNMTFTTQENESGTKRKECALIDTGILVFTGSVYLSLLSLIQDHHSLLLENYLRFELYSELLMSFTVRNNPNLSMNFVSYAKKFSKDIDHKTISDYSLYEQCLFLLWKTFSSSRLKLLCIPNGSFAHLGTSKELVDLIADRSLHEVYYQGKTQVLSHSLPVEYYSILSFGASGVLCAMKNSTSKIFLEYSLITKPVDCGSMGIFSHISSSVSQRTACFPGMMIQQIPIQSPVNHSLSSSSSCYILAVLSFEDNVKLSWDENGATIGGISWNRFLKVNNILFTF
jgi:fucokinase